ncbi:MAG: hypothetical protein K0S33_808 [Bacteroidetes bacterium]|jgi:hypothetical protein|nr:hypothetical protein [Bacteroidota bacterium]
MRFFIILLLLSGISSFAQKKTKAVVSDASMLTNKDTFEYFTIADTNYSAYRLPTVLNKPQTWKKRDAERMGPLGNSYLVTYTDTLNLEKVLQILDGEKEFYQICAAKSWCNNHYKEVFPYLVARLTSKQKIGLDNSADLIIWERINTGDMKFYGHGGSLDYDLFTTAGRVSWILNDLTGEKFAIVKAGTIRKEAMNYKLFWKEYLDKLKT